MKRAKTRESAGDGLCHMESKTLLQLKYYMKASPCKTLWASVSGNMRKCRCVPALQLILVQMSIACLRLVYKFT